MGTLNLPAGLSVRDIAERLGVSAERLGQHAGVTDVEAPLKAERRVEIPDGFFRDRELAARRDRGIPQSDGRGQGLNDSVALNMEHLRTRLAGGMGSFKPTASELEALAEARRAYLRFEAQSNELARELYRAIGNSQSHLVRAQAYAGEALAWAHGALVFGEPSSQARLQGISCAKSAIMADPKWAAAHLAMALALRVDAEGADAAAAFDALERGLQIKPKDPWLWAAMGEHLVTLDDAEGARQAFAMALDQTPAHPLASLGLAQLERAAGSLEAAAELLNHAVGELETFADLFHELSLIYDATGEAAAAGDARRRALEAITSDAHRHSLVGDDTDQSGP